MRFKERSGNTVVAVSGMVENYRLDAQRGEPTYRADLGHDYNGDTV